MSYYLFLDDTRTPPIAANWIYPVELRPLYRLQEWVIVRSYIEFVFTLLQRGMPIYVSFDYDIEGDRSGYDCAVWLVDYCNKHSLALPQTIIHSKNDEKRDTIRQLFEHINPK
jgi:hypothetical protein